MAVPLMIWLASLHDIFIYISICCTLITLVKKDSKIGSFLLSEYAIGSLVLINLLSIVKLLDSLLTTMLLSAFP